MQQSSGFYGLGIAPNLLGVLNKLGFITPTPIQEKSIPPGLEGKDLVGVAQTGTGKTLAFGIPMMQAVLGGRQGLIILPTRELAYQVQETFKKIGTPLGITTVLLIGGDSMFRQIQGIKRHPMVVIGTPGRIIDHLEQKNINLSKVSMLVLDEADRMLDMGFAPQLKRILSAVPSERQTMLFSATMPEEILSLARSYMKLPARIEVAPQGTTAEKVTQELFFVERNDKSRLLEKLLGEYRGSVLVFSRTKHGAKKIASNIRALGHTVSELHANKSLNARREALDGFRNGKYRVLVATDIAARGIDVKGIELVVNYDLPDNTSDYVHRIGRTARAGGTGHAISFATPDQRGDVRSIERLIGITLPLSKIPELPPSRYNPNAEPDRPSFRGRPGFGARPSFGGGRPPFRGGRPSSGPHRPSSFPAPAGSAPSTGARPSYPPRRPGPRRFGPRRPQ